MQKLTKEQMLSELMIKLESIDGKLDKLLVQQSPVDTNVTVNVEDDYVPDGLLDYIKNNVKEFNEKPTRWPNESYEDYLKRIGEYNTAQSDEEIFREGCK